MAQTYKKESTIGEINKMQIKIAYQIGKDF
jgi:hypothetical protein